MIATQQRDSSDGAGQLNLRIDGGPRSSAIRMERIRIAAADLIGWAGALAEEVNSP